MFNSLLSCHVWQVEQIPRRRLLMLFPCLALLSMTACDYGTPKRPKNKFTQPPFETSKSITIEKAREIAENTAIDDGVSIEQVSLFKKNKMAQPKGLLTESLFTTPVADNTERFARLETIVQELVTKINNLDPKIQRLTDIDRDLENLTYQLEILVNDRDGIIKQEPEFRDASLETPQTPPSIKREIEPEIIEAKIPVPPQDIAPASGSNNDIISGGAHGYVPSQRTTKLRIADHSGKTRLVFEGAEKIEVSFSMPQNGRSATATFAHKIDLDTSTIARKSSLIKHATMKDQTLQLMLSAKSEKIGQGYLPPTDQNPNHRVYIDLKR